jgi:ABC-type sugar transport system substrate-binding protein
MKKVKVLAILVVVCMLFALAACQAPDTGTTESESVAVSSSDTESSETASEETASATEEVAEGEGAYMLPPDGKSDGERKIGATVIVGVSPHVQAWIEGVQDVVESHGDEFVVLDPNFDALVQTQQVDDLVAAGCDGIVIETIDGEALVSSVKKAVDQGVFVTSSDLPFSETNTDLIVSQVMSDNFNGGAEIAQKMCDDLGGEGQVILLYYPGQGSAEREEGMRSVIDQYPGVEIVATGDGGGVIEQANKLMQNLMQAHPDLDAVIATNDHGVIGAMTALESAGRLQDVGIYGFDAVPEAVQFIEEGKMTASIRQNPYLMGKMSAEDLYAAMNGEEVGDKLKRVATEYVDINNAEDYETYATE